MSQVLGIIAVVLGGGALGVLGLSLGSKLSRLRRHRKSEEFQTLFTRNRLD